VIIFIGTSLSNHSWTSSQSNVYDQIDCESIHTNINNNNSPPYTPHSPMNDISEHYYYRLPTPSCLTSEQTNSKKELHKELVHRQKM